MADFLKNNLADNFCILEIPIPIQTLEQKTTHTQGPIYTHN